MGAYGEGEHEIPVMVPGRGLLPGGQPGPALSRRTGRPVRPLDFIYYGHSANDTSKPFLGLGVPDWIAILGVGSGVILMLIARVKAPRFFRERRLIAGDPIDTVTPEAVFAPAETML